jgi:hypothetical protein
VGWRSQSMQHRRDRHERHAKQQREHGVQHAFEGGQPSRAVFDHEVDDRDSASTTAPRRSARPRTVPFAPGQRQEQEGVCECARGVQRQFDARGAPPAAARRFVVPGMSMQPSKVWRSAGKKPGS